jgi:hypothetical protein
LELSRVKLEPGSNGVAVKFVIVASADALPAAANRQSAEATSEKRIDPAKFDDELLDERRALAADMDVPLSGGANYFSPDELDTNVAAFDVKEILTAGTGFRALMFCEGKP